MPTFDERAATWDSPDKVERAIRLAEQIAAAIPLASSMRVVELGAGTGLLGLALHEAVPGGFGELVLTDPSRGMLEVASAKIARAGVDDHVRVVPFDLAADPPEQLGRFDLVVSLLVLHHVADSGAVLRSAHALLDEAGWLALSDLDREDGSFHDPGTEGIHHHGFDRDGLASLAAASGFVDVGIADAGTVEREGRRYSLFLLTGRRA